MKRVRITYPGALHHVMNRGFGGNEIFFEKETKSQFLDYLQELSACFVGNLQIYTHRGRILSIDLYRQITMITLR